MDWVERQVRRGEGGKKLVDVNGLLANLPHPSREMSGTGL